MSTISMTMRITDIDHVTFHWLKIWSQIEAEFLAITAREKPEE